MAGVVNLNRFRKEKARAGRRAEAESNALKHGRTRAEILLDKARAEKSTRDLEAHRRDGSDESG